MLCNYTLIKLFKKIKTFMNNRFEKNKVEQRRSLSFMQSPHFADDYLW